MSRLPVLQPRFVFAALVAAAFASPVLGQHASHAASSTPTPIAASAPATAVSARVLGEVIPFGAGTARSWVDFGPDGLPAAVGVTLTEAALEGLPATATPGLIWTTEYILDLPDVAGLPFNHIGVNWNPHGHMPSGVYNVPHFDFHFYSITPDVRRGITARGDDLERGRRAPASGLLPEGYVFAPDSEEPGMGGHWADPGAHEFHGHDFTSTFIFGTYDGSVIFWEPMVTRAFLLTKPDMTETLRLPQAYGAAGFYPTDYRIQYDGSRQEYTISLGGMASRPQLATQ